MAVGQDFENLDLVTYYDCTEVLSCGQWEQQVPELARKCSKRDESARTRKRNGRSVTK